jgi:hypothetical protein
MAGYSKICYDGNSFEAGKTYFLRFVRRVVDETRVYQV